MRHISGGLQIALLAALVVGPSLAQGPEPAGAQEPEMERPDRGVARISVINGDVTIQRGDSGERIAAAVNAPLVVDDRIATGPGSRAEIQFDYSNFVRLSPDSEVRIPDLQDDRYLLQVGRGTVTFRVLRESRAQVEVSTPTVSVRPSRIGSYRITVHEDGQSEITARSGELEVYTQRGVERVQPGQTMQVRGSAADPEFQMVRAPREDDWDRWSDHRDQDLSRSTSYQHMSRDIYGGEELDAYGQWIDDPAYGQVWSPSVAPGWAPYQQGRWVWVDWYGWTWVSSDPWGWAPYHYGRWYYGSVGWCWYPGAGFGRHYWSPGLVAFFGFGGYGRGGGFGFGGLGWVPLAPHERFHPWYGRGIYGGYRNTNAFVNNVNIVNNTNITNSYRNARVANGVTGVTAQDFTQGHFNNRVSLSGTQMQQASLMRGAVPIAPQAANLRVSNAAASPAARISPNSGHFFSRNQPTPVNRVPFEQQRQSLQQASSAIAPRMSQNNVVGNAGSQAAGPGSWRRFGEPAGRGQAGVSMAPNSPASSPSTESRGWRRFGEPSRDVPGSVGRQAPTVRQSNPSTGPQGANEGWQRPADRPPTAGVTPSPRNSFGAQGNGRSLQVAPPVVRQRSVPSGGGYSYGAPPASRGSAPSSAPRSSGGGGRSSGSPSGGGRSSGGGGRSGGGGGSHSGGGHGR